MQARIKNPALAVPGTQEARQKLGASAGNAGIPKTTEHLVYLRASQINGCSVCTDMHSRELERDGERNERIFTVAAWHEVPYFTDAERAALALTEAATWLADHPDPMPDAVWKETARHYSEPQLAALLVLIATINAWNCLMVDTRQISGEWVAHVSQPDCPSAGKKNAQVMIGSPHDWEKSSAFILSGVEVLHLVCGTGSRLRAGLRGTIERKRTLRQKKPGKTPFLHFICVLRIFPFDCPSEAYNALRAYTQSKLAQICFTYELVERLAGTSVTVNALDPGHVVSHFNDSTKGLLHVIA